MKATERYKHVIFYGRCYIKVLLVPYVLFWKRNVLYLKLSSVMKATDMRVIPAVESQDKLVDSVRRGRITHDLTP